MESTLLHKLDSFFTRYKPLYFKRGETILRAGDPPLGFFYLKKGFVRVYSIAKNGEELTLIIFKPGDFFPLVWAINNASNDYFVEAMTGCEIARAPREEFVSFVVNNPDVSYDLTKRTLVRLGGLMRRMEYLVFGNAGHKVASILLICAERFGKKIGRNVIIKVPLRHQDIATLVGMTRETVSIEMKRLERKGVCVHKGKFLVIKLSALKHESQL
ncbi:Crp/Fnr family transcriptional regulator [Candidatus Curtissbacteria bacterium]|nr:Crp/Fnr family transcriptional regulator [Candidatus Curtissbacteria bacterium]